MPTATPDLRDAQANEPQTLEDDQVHEDGMQEDENMSSDDYIDVDIYMTPEIGDSNLYLMQFPNRKPDRPYKNLHAQSLHDFTPSAFRIKPESGFVELDVPIREFDPGAAKEYEASMKKVEGEGANGFGIASGFLGAQGVGGRARARPKPNNDVVMKEEEDEPEIDPCHTLGGQIFKQDKNAPRFMLAAMKYDSRTKQASMHLTPLDSIIQMRPQLHHVDAKNLTERLKARASTVGGTEAAARALEPRYHTTTSKSAANDNIDEAAASAKKILQQAHDEAWVRLEWVDEDRAEAFDTYNQTMFVDESKEDIELITKFSNMDYLDAVAPSKHKPIANPKGKDIAGSARREDQMIEISSETDSDD